MVLDDKQRKIGRDNFDDASRLLTRRQMLSGAVAVRPLRRGHVLALQQARG